MAVSQYALTTLANARAALGIPAADTSKDTLLEQYIDRATFEIEGLTGRKFKARKYNGASGTFTLGGSDTITNEDYIFFSGYQRRDGGDTDVISGLGVFYLPQYPVLPNTDQVFKLGVLSTRLSSGETWDDTLYAEWQDFVVERDTGVVRLLMGPFAPGYRNYRITMAAGYKTGAAQPYVPPDLEQLCIAVIKKLYRNDYGLTMERIGTWHRVYDIAKQDAFIESVLSLYRRPYI